MPPSSTAPTPGGPSASAPATTTSPPLSYSAVAAKAPMVFPRLHPVPLASRPPTFVDNIPAILFTNVEEEQLRRQRENTLILKFSAGKPSPYEIRCHIASEWNLDIQPAVGILDPRHITLHMGSAADTKRALAHTENKIKTSLFRLFRWTPDFEVGKDSSLAAVWVKFSNLPLHYFNEASLIKLGSLLGTVLRIHPSTLALTQQSFAKVCIEMDVSKPFVDTLWIGTSKDYGWLVSVEYEGNHAFSQYCGLLGHTIGLCRKKREVQGKAKMDEGPQTSTKPPAQTSLKISSKGQWVAKDGSAHISQAVTTANQNSNVAANQIDNLQNSDIGNTHEKVTIMKNPIERVNSETRQVLLKAGLLSPSTSESSQQPNLPGPVLFADHSKEDSQYNMDDMVNESLMGRTSDDKNFFAEDPTVKNQALIDLVNSGHTQRLLPSTDTISDVVLHPEITHLTEVSVQPEPPIQLTSVLSPNKFSVLGTEDALHMAYENLQHLNRSNNKVEKQKYQIDSLAIVPMENESMCLSDGTGTKDITNLGVPFTQSAPNSDGEQELENHGHRTRKVKKGATRIRKSTRTGKVQHHRVASEL